MLGEITTNANALICGDRQDQYGKPEDNFGRWAQLVNAQFGTRFEPGDMAVVAALLKIARSAHQKKRDSFVDAAGYIDIAGELYGVNDDQPASRGSRRRAAQQQQ